MSQPAASDFFNAADEYAAFSESDWDAVPGLASQPSSQEKAWRSPAVHSPFTPSNEHAHPGALLGDNSPSTPSRPSRSAGRLGSTSAIIARNLRDVKIDDDEELPPPKRLFGFGATKDDDQNLTWIPEDDMGDSDEDVRLVDDMLQEGLSASSAAMNPPAIIPNPRPLQSSSTQSSFASTSSSNSLFSNFSRTSSTSSIGSPTETRSSPLKRSAEMSSPSPSKTRKLAPAQHASSQSPPTGSPTPSSTNMASPFKLQLSIQPQTALDKKGSFSLAELFGGNYGTKLEVHVIAHSTEVQKRFDAVGVHLGVQWELARGVSTKKWTWEEVEDKFETHFDALRSTNSQVADTVSSLMRGRPGQKPQNLALWNEVDREHEAIVEGKSRGLGLGGRWKSWDGQSDYYGGQIQYPLRLFKADEGGEGNYQIYLEKPQKGRSHRFARDLGSPSVLQLSIPTQLVRDEGEDVKRFLAKRFVINGRVFVAIPPKDKTSVYLIQINQDWNRAPLPWYGDQFRISFDEFLQRHNPPDLNSQQPFAKYTARYALGLSTSTPVLEFEKQNIFYIKDVLAQGWDPKLKPPAEKIMTDGCGFINRSGLLLITKTVGYDSLPTAVQGRIGGAKGLWILHPTDEDANPKIWIRDSQLKIHLQGDHRVHRIFDLLRASHPSQTEARYELSEQSILCLSSNGIPDDILVSLLVEGLEHTVKPLLNWGAGAMPALWRAIGNAGAVPGTRLQRVAGSKSRILGFRDREPEERDVDLEPVAADSDDLETTNRSGRDNGGGPASLHERAMELLQAGFHPTTSAYLNDKMRYIIKTEINSVVDKYRISLPESTASDAFVIPDPFGILKENEIYYRSSNPMKNPDTQTLFQILVGPVILGRYPIRLPCDMQMVTAVDVPELYNWPDVIITSTAGQQSLLSLLSGGDYDGDTVIFIWLEAFLKNFRNQPFTPPPPNFMAENFEQEVKTVDEVGGELRRKSPEESERAFQEHLLVGLRDNQVGLYSFFHDNAIWRHGYNHPNSILMAYIGNTLLDAGKTGLCLKSEVFEKHQKAFGHKRPKTNNWTGTRDITLPPFILQALSEAGKAKGDTLLRAHDSASGKLSEAFKDIPKDVDLLKPYTTAKAKSSGASGWCAIYKSELAAIEQHIEGVKKLYNAMFAIPTERKAERTAAALQMHTTFAQPILKIEMLDAIVVEELKASYAYSLKEEFGFTVAFITLCVIKARATPGGIAPNGRQFDELKAISGAASRATLDEDDDV
ncbi:RNA dependent RNA polymerase-domain-containing protein [Mycena vulgaris]|nr:RNA dependent RNA polymerase-domain-containing protein [Mycena vulgaris]